MIYHQHDRPLRAVLRSRLYLTRADISPIHGAEPDVWVLQPSTMGLGPCHDASGEVRRRMGG